MAERAVALKKTTGVIAERKRRVFLRVLAKTCVVAQAAKAAGYSDTTTLQAFRRNNEDFAEEWEQAMESGANMLEEEVMRRAKDGVLEPTFYKGEIVGHTRKFSDSLAMFLLRGMKPDTYRENARGGETTVNFGIAVMPPAAKSDEAWEARAVEMHGKQEIIVLEDKPHENQMLRVKRGD